MGLLRQKPQIPSTKHETGANTVLTEEYKQGAWQGRGFDTRETRLPLPIYLLSVTSDIRTIHIRHFSAVFQTEKSFSQSQEPEM